MVQLAMSAFLEHMPSRKAKYELLQTLRDTSEGKLFLEKEYAVCTRSLCEMYEADGEVEKATVIIQEIQIETYGSIEAKEKVSFILYQMQLVLMRSDFVRCQILSRKISKKNINEVGFEELKIQFFKFMVRFYVHEKMHLETAKAYQTIFDTYKTAPTDMALDTTGDLKKRAFQNFILYLLLCSHSNEKVDLLNIAEKNYQRSLDEDSLLQRYVSKFLVFELMPLDESTL